MACERKSDTVTTGANGAISKSLRKYTRNILAKHEIKELQKNSHIGHCTRTAGSVDVKVQGRNNITCSKNCKYRTAATSHTLETFLVSGI